MAKIQTITAQEVQARLDKGEVLQILDVRENPEVANGMIPGALHIRLSDVEERLDEIDREAETIVVCRSGRRSQSVCNFLHAQGYHNIKNMRDGMLAWKGETENYYP
ncbi:MAG: rhodanese-like domain-containing protein [Tumebacillaceae bacterium]